jgi:hypothetical protein
MSSQFLSAVHKYRENKLRGLERNNFGGKEFDGHNIKSNIQKTE